MEFWKERGNDFERCLKSVLVFCVALYRTVGSQHLGGQCRFHPSCSHYALEALNQHPVFSALPLILRRLSRCHPFGSSGWDPVPERKEKSTC
ncbi:MAG: membrane protein insertion efficiency factor YidD [Bdellovibrionales bacterium]